jgi:Ni,Fe-hydrogenase III small subunit
LLESLTHAPLTEAPPSPSAAALAELSSRVDAAARKKLGRSLSIRQVDAGSCNGCELEIHALNNAFYDLERFGMRFVASPRHADVLLVTGPVTRNMREALELTYRATPDPKWVVALGDCAVQRNFLRQLRRHWRNFECGTRRPAHSRLPAIAN